MGWEAIQRKGKEKKKKGKESKRGKDKEAMQNKGKMQRKGKERRQQQSNLRHARTSCSVFTCRGLWSSNEFDPG